MSQYPYAGIDGESGRCAQTCAGRLRFPPALGGRNASQIWSKIVGVKTLYHNSFSLVPWCPPAGRSCCSRCTRTTGSCRRRRSSGGRRRGRAVAVSRCTCATPTWSSSPPCSRHWRRSTSSCASHNPRLYQFDLLRSKNPGRHVVLEKEHDLPCVPPAVLPIKRACNALPCKRH